MTHPTATGAPAAQSDHTKTYVLFEVGRANLGNAQRRLPMRDLVARWNRKLRPHGVQFRAFARHTGNYVATTARRVSPDRLRRLLMQTLASRFAAFRALEFMRWYLPMSGRLKPTSEKRRRRTPGVVMDLHCTAGPPGRPPDTADVIFTEHVWPRVRGVYKLDVLRADGKFLDDGRRRGGWGAVATMMEEHAGGEWTARAFSTVELIARRLDDVVDARPWRFISFDDDLRMIRT